MKSVLVDKEFFNLRNKYSEGLISGLKKLSESSFEIFTSEINSVDPILQNILKLENISLKENKKAQPECDFRIVAKGKASESSIAVGKENIKTFYDAANKIIRQKRTATIKRKTKETDIEINVNLDGSGKSKIKTGIGFFNHMLDQIARHANLDLIIKVKGDLEVDEHHTIEDTGIALGEAIKNALGSKKGIKRYGYFIPMDESVAVCSIDLSGRHYLNYSCKFNREYVGELPTEMVKEFFRGISAGMTANLYISAKGENDHHKIEAMFKSFAKALNEACRIDERAGNSLPTTKGLL